MSDPIRVGLIGHGYASKTFHAPLVSGTPGMTLAAAVLSAAANPPKSMLHQKQEIYVLRILRA